MKDMKTSAIIRNDKLSSWAKSLKYSLYVIFHPMDGFWDLTHEKRGSLAAANTIMILLLLTRIWKLQFSSFLVMTVRWEYLNLFKEMLSIVAPIIIACVGNWCLSTLFDGKGRLKDIYIGFMYAFTPYVIFQVPLIIIGNLSTNDELAFYNFFSALCIVWTGCLLLSAIMMIHDYSFSKALLCSLVTIVAMGVIIFIILLFFSLISDAIAYFVSLYKEIIFRFY